MMIFDSGTTSIIIEHPSSLILFTKIINWRLIYINYLKYNSKSEYKSSKSEYKDY